MLHTETVTSGTLECLKELMQDENISDFFLVGGTALSLQIGHRISIDIDLFSKSTFDENKMLEYLETSKDLKSTYQDKNTLKGKIDKIQVDLITHPYPLVKPLIVIEGIRLARLEDIAAMKLNAISGNGTRAKDFIDIACLSCYLTLEQMVDAYKVKYSERNTFMVLKSLAFTDDVNKKEHIDILNHKYSWKDTEERIEQMMNKPTLLFSSLPYKLAEGQKQETKIKQQPKNQLKRGRGI
ncbi:MAG: nucleotidyl transferase AbiEii/AbiGii toxin family protein [Chitinophagaceae bacterium]